MARLVCLLCAYFLLCTGLQSGSSQPILDTGQGVRTGAPGGVFTGSGIARPEVQLRGLCRDGWRGGKMRDVSGNEIPVCLKINTESQTWSEAQQSCRRDFGFLLKLDSSAKVDDHDLFSSIYGSGITKFWTGLHTSHNHLVWDDIIPNKVRPQNRLNLTDEHYSRPWRWQRSLLEDRDEYCGMMDINVEDGDRKRRRRSPDDDDGILNFDISKLRNSPFGNPFGNTHGNTPSMAEALQSLISRSPINRANRLRSNPLAPRASAFQSMLSRQPSMDLLDELPSSSAFGIQSDPQIPGSGLVETNLEKGGLATFPTTVESTSESDGVTDTPLGNSEGSSANSEGSVTNLDALANSDVGNVLDSLLGESHNSFENTQDVNGELLDAVREAANNLNEMSESSSDPIDTLKSHILENENTFSKTDTSNDEVTQTTDGQFGSLTTTLSPVMDTGMNIGLTTVAENLAEKSDNLMSDMTDNSNEAENSFPSLEDQNTGTIDRNDWPSDVSHDSDPTVSDESNSILEQNAAILEKLLDAVGGSDENHDIHEQTDILSGNSVNENDDAIAPLHVDDIVKSEDTNSFTEQANTDSLTPGQTEDTDSIDTPILSGEDDHIESESKNDSLESTSFSSNDDSLQGVNDDNDEGLQNEILQDQLGDSTEMDDANSQSIEPSSEVDVDQTFDSANFQDILDDLKETVNTHATETTDHEHDDESSQVKAPDTSSSNSFPEGILDSLSEPSDDLHEDVILSPEVGNDDFDHDNVDILDVDRDDSNFQDAIDPLEILQNQIKENDFDIGDRADDQIHLSESKNLFEDSDAIDSSEHLGDDTLENNDHDVQDVIRPIEHDDVMDWDGEVMDQKENDDHDSNVNLVNPTQFSEEDQNSESLNDDFENGNDDFEQSKGFMFDSLPNDMIDTSLKSDVNDEMEHDETNGLDDVGDDLQEVVGQDTVKEWIDSDREEGLKNDSDISNESNEEEESDDATSPPMHSADMSTEGDTLENDDDTRTESEDDDVPDVLEGDDTTTAISPVFKDNTMGLSGCEQKLPSVCFSYDVEVMDKAPTCDDGWYGHVLLDTCYKILDKKYNYKSAVTNCASSGARLVLSDSQFERDFVLLAVQKEGQKFRGGKYWMETTNQRWQQGCTYFDERGVHQQPTCNTAMYVVCVKDAKSLSVFHSNDALFKATGMRQQDRLFSSKSGDNVLRCELHSGASEFPVLWFKDGVLLEAKDTYVTSDTSLRIDEGLLSGLTVALDETLEMPALQGRYWCEVWDRKSLTRRKSAAYNVRFSDVITFHGSLEVAMVTHQAEVLFNMMNEKFSELEAVEGDLRKVYRDVLPVLQKSQPDVTDVFTYVDKIRSFPSVAEYHAYFLMSRDVQPDDEDAIYAKIKSVLRAHLGNRNYMASLPGKTTIATFRTMSLQSTVSCPAASLQTNRDLLGHTGPTQVFSFPKALLGDFANSLDQCSPTNPMPAGTARCLGDFYTGAFWGEVVANECVEEMAIDSFNKEVWGASPFTSTLSEMAQTPVDEGNAAQLIDELSRISNVAAKFTPTDINKIADVFDHTTQVGNLGAAEGTAMVKTVDKLMTTNRREAHIANIETKAANRIIKSVERFAENANLQGKKNVRVVSENVVVEIWDLKADDMPVIGLAAESHVSGSTSGFIDRNIATIYNKSHLVDANVDAAIELPVEVFSRKEKGERLTNRLTMMVFRRNQLFEAAVSDDGRKMNPTDEQLNSLNSYVISASIAGKRLTGLKEKVRTIFKPLKESDSSRSCVWWDFDMHAEKGGWSTEGCSYDGRINGRDVCRCDHLTNFAVLLDFYGQAEPIPDEHDLSLSIITILGLSCSIIGLCLTIISYIFFKKLRKGRAQQTLFNLSLALLFSMLVFLVGIKQTHSYWGCIGVAMLLHYFILASFMWMLMEAILQYLTFVKILGTYITRFTLKTVIPAWGLPMLPVIAVLSVDYHLYKGGPNYCWMDLPAFYYAFIVPVSLVIFINVIIFIITVVSIFRRGKGLRSNQKKHKMAVTNLQAAITSFVLLGLTWLFGYLAISDARLPFQYVFTILNSLQGFFIFVLFVLRKKKVREQWFILCCRPGERDKVSRTLSASNSSYSNSSNRNSRNTKHERDRSDSTKTVQSTYSNSSDGFTNFGYEHGYDFPYNRQEKRAFRKL